MAQRMPMAFMTGGKEFQAKSDHLPEKGGRRVTALKAAHRGFDVRLQLLSGRTIGLPAFPSCLEAVLDELSLAARNDTLSKLRHELLAESLVAPQESRLDEPGRHLWVTSRQVNGLRDVSH
jgi:hypothetical protein